MEGNIFTKINSAFKKVFGRNEQVAPKADFAGSGGGYRNLFTVSYNGEKNLGEIGPIRDYRLDYDGLRMRSWQSYLESEITQTVINRFATWVIGDGLKLQAEPVGILLKSEKIDLDTQVFCEAVEARFNVFRNSKSSDYSNMKNLDLLAKKAFKNAIIGGDVLVVLRYIDDALKIQLIDGVHLCSPVFGSEYYPQILPNGNTIRNGIEMNARGEHVRYFIRDMDFKTRKIEAREEATGLQVAFLVYGMEYRLDNVRGIPLVSTVLETLKKLERYKEATVGSAEERQKIAYSIEHGTGSTGENPLTKNLAKAFDVSAGGEDIPRDQQGRQLADTIAATTNKQAFNMPIDSKLNMLESKNELYFKDFYTVNIDLVCASLGIPPEVAMSKYDSNFSASRAALKDWEHTLRVTRKEFAFMFYQPIYNFWLEIQILKNKIAAPGYLSAKSKSDKVIMDAYRCARFVGSAVPHIDPLKEVNAERAKLGSTGAHLPLTTLEAATEALNTGESDSNMEQYAEELVFAKQLKIELPKEPEKKPNNP